jgi:DNA-binding NarL/FixJ family response regulator
MKLDFAKREFDEYVEHCGFTDEEIKLLTLKRRGLLVSEIATTMDYCEKSIIRKTKRVIGKIIKYEFIKNPCDKTV